MTSRPEVEIALHHAETFALSFAEVLQELPAPTVEQLLIGRALELDDAPLAEEDEALVEERLATTARTPDSAVPLDTMKQRLRSRVE